MNNPDYLYRSSGAPRDFLDEKYYKFLNRIPAFHEMISSALKIYYPVGFLFKIEQVDHMAVTFEICSKIASLGKEFNFVNSLSIIEDWDKRTSHENFSKNQPLVIYGLGFKYQSFKERALLESIITTRCLGGFFTIIITDTVDDDICDWFSPMTAGILIKKYMLFDLSLFEEQK